MSVTRITIAVGLLVYVGLWILEFNGANGLLAPLLIPLVLAVMVAGGVALDRFIGITPHKPKWDDREKSDD